MHAHLGALTNFEPHSLSNNNWRRMPGAFNLDRGPCVKKENASHWWSTWECAALAHFSFFRNFQAGRMQDFTFGVWDFHADRWERGPPQNETENIVHQPVLLCLPPHAVSHFMTGPEACCWVLGWLYFTLSIRRSRLCFPSHNA